MAAPVRAMANQVALSVCGGPDRVSRSRWPGREEIVVSHQKLSRNAPCPCGSGKKYKHCCYGKGGEDGPGPGSGRQPPQCPIGTVAMYGPDDRTTTKIAAGVILH